MAKRSGGRKKASKPASRGRATKTQQKAAAPAKKTGARSQTLPGMSKVRNQRLDNLCEAIAEDRRTMASARNDEQGSIQAALREMKGRKFSSYRHAGVELAFVAGQD